MKDLEKKMLELSEAIRKLGNASNDMATLAGQIIVDSNEIERMKNCVNCDHSEVCFLVARRKAQKANDYTPCSKWKLVEARERQTV